MLQASHAAPNFHLADLADRAYALPELLQDGPVLLVFFKVSCPTCQYTFPFLERLHHSAHAKRLRVFGISQDEPASTQNFAQRYGVTFPLLLDRESDGFPASTAYQITNVPSFFAIEEDGSIRHSFMGFSKADLVELAHELQVEVFRDGEKIPEFRPG